MKTDQRRPQEAAGSARAEDNQTIEIVPDADTLPQTLLNSLEQRGFTDTLDLLAVAQPADRYTDEMLRRITALLEAAGAA
jgi:hypothetical protein